MIELTAELEAIGRDLQAALGKRIARKRRSSRRLGYALVTAFAAFAAFAGTAVAVGDDLHLDPTKWTIFAGGSVDNGRGEYVKAHATDGSGDSTFMVEHDAGLDRYYAFLLHERTVEAAGGNGETGDLCSRAELTRAEQIALDALRSGRAPASAVSGEFAGQACRGLDYAVEQATFVHDGVEPAALLMPGVR